MNATALLEQLQGYQAETVALCRSAGEHYNRQAHVDISPVGWHLGHCVFTESYWIHEVFLQDAAVEESLHALYNPLHMQKTKRGLALPSNRELCDWGNRVQSANRSTLIKALDHHDDMDLMANHFLLHFLIQHYAQHLETMYMAFAQINRALNGSDVDIIPLQESREPGATVNIRGGEYNVGSELPLQPYDNEYPVQTCEIENCHIMRRPVSNAAYLYFMQQGGYGEKRFWCENGWRWRETNEVMHPAYWWQDTLGKWSVIDHEGHRSLDPAAPVHGISWYEASAFARWAGGRLPHEHEWETARKAGELQDHGRVWEWCRNPFYPYDGFHAYPYDGYSVPYFDGEHFTLKGGSRLTRDVIKRPAFRNYYQADKNFLYAGMRLVFE